MDYDDFILPSFAFMQARLQQSKQDFHVYNLSPDSRLPAEIVPKLDIAGVDALLASLEPRT